MPFATRARFVLVHTAMGIALVVFLGVVPAGLVVLAARSPSSASLRRSSATVTVAGTATLDVARVGGRVRSHRLFGAVGAVVGLWATAAWESTTFSWDGLLASAARPSPLPSASSARSLLSRLRR